MKAIVRFTTVKTNGNKQKHIFIAKNYKGWTFENKGNILKLQDGKKIYKYGNCIYSSIEDVLQIEKKNKGYC